MCVYITACTRVCARETVRVSAANLEYPSYALRFKTAALTAEPRVPSWLGVRACMVLGGFGVCPLAVMATIASVHRCSDKYAT